MHSLVEVAKQALLLKSTSGQLTFGRLMSPEQVKKAVANRTGPEGQLRDWCVASQVDEQMFEKLKAAGQWWVGVGVHPVGHHRFLRMSHAIGDCRHHAVLPVYGPTMKQFLRTLQSRPTWVSLAKGDTEDAVLQSLQLADWTADWAAPSNSMMDGELREVINGLMLYAGLLTLPGFQAETGADQKSRHISVSIVTPDDFDDLALLTALEPGSGRPS
jgi:hypothetical protein